jgi:hypothetical protein
MFADFADVLADDQDRDAWLAARRGLVTASDAAAILVPRDVSLLPPEAQDVANAWRAGLEVYADKVGAMPPRDDAEWMLWGRRLEPNVAAAWADDCTRGCAKCGRVWTWSGQLPAEWTLLKGVGLRWHNTRRGPRTSATLQCVYCKRALRPRQVDRCGLLLRSREFPWLGATPDYVGRRPDRPDPGTLQCKVSRNAWDAVPGYVQVQVQTEMLVSGCQWGSVAVLVSGQAFQWCDFEADADLQAAIVAGSRRFWEDHVQAEVPPAPIGPPASIKRALAALYPRQRPASRLFLQGDDWVAKAAELKAAKAEAKRQGDLAELLAIEFKAAAGDHEVVSLDDGTYFTCKRQRIPERTQTIPETEFRALRYWED